MPAERYANQTVPIKFCELHQSVFEDHCPLCGAQGLVLSPARYNEICEVCEDFIASYRGASGTLVCQNCREGAPEEELPFVPLSLRKPSPELLSAITVVCDIMVDAVASAGALGAPAGVLYAGCMAHMSLDQFEGFMAGLVAVGRLKKRGDLYFVGENSL
jgi:hypothetical protein